MSLVWDIAASSHKGGREEQQDRVGTFILPGDDSCLLVVADGLGGHGGGALAAEAVIEAARISIPHLHDAPEMLLDGICNEANRRIAELERSDFHPRSTVVAAWLGAGERAHWAHVGDSRLYRFRDGEYFARTADHSVVQMLVDMGKITDAEMAGHPDQNRLLRTLGGEASSPDVEGGDVRPGDSFLLCSDGLWEHVTPEEMAAALAGPDLKQAAHELVVEAFRRGGDDCDNISIAVARRSAAPTGGILGKLAGHLGVR